MKLIISTICVVFIFLFCACSGIIESVKEDPKGALSFGLNVGEVQTATRATESTYSALKTAAARNSGSYIQLHTYAGNAGSSMSQYFSDQLYFDSEHNAWSLESAIPRFLPDRSLNVFAYYATNNAQQGDLSDIVYRPPYDAASYPTLDYTIHQTDAFDQVDLLAAKVEEVNSAHVVIPFKHLLAQVNFGVKGVKDYAIKVSNIRIKNVFGKGSYDFETGHWAHSEDHVENLHSYPYYFPDRNTETLSGGSGANYQTAGSSDDSNNIYLYGDGGKFSPGSSTNFWYAQKDPTASSFLNKDQTSQSAGNSLMLLPQNIKENISALVEFDFVLIRNGKIVASKIGEKIPLKDYADWKPNLRYVYLFDFSNYAQEIKFEVLVKPWENWDSDGINNGIKNATIQEPTESKLNQMSNNDAIYLDGLLERNEVWDWSSYSLTSFNTLTLDFTSVELNGYSIDLRLPTGFRTSDLPNPITTEGRIKIVREHPIVSEPTEGQLNRMVSGRYLTIDGALQNSQVWDWRSIAFERLIEQKSFTIKFLDVDFQGNSIQLLLPNDFSTTSSIISSAQEVVITNNRAFLITQPSESILNALSDDNVIELCCGSIISNSIWDWKDVRFDNLEIQEQFSITFSDVKFFVPLKLILPGGYVAIPSDVISSNGTVFIKNNRILWPHDIELNALVPDQTIKSSGGAIYANEELDWSTIQFTNIEANKEFKFDLSNVAFASNTLKLHVPPTYIVSGQGVIGTNPYLINSASVLTIKNAPLVEPSVNQLNAIYANSTVDLSGTFVTNHHWNWSNVAFTALGGIGNHFSLDFSKVLFRGAYIDLTLPIGCYAVGATLLSGNTYRISSPTIVAITDHSIPTHNNQPSSQQFASLLPGQTMVLSGTINTLTHWDWARMITPNISSGQSFSIDFTRVLFSDPGSAYIYLVNTNLDYLLSGNYSNTWAIVINTSGKVTFTKRLAAPTVAELNALISGSSYSINGTLQNDETWDWSGAHLSSLGASGNTFSLNFTGVVFDSHKIKITLPAGCIATGTATLVSGTTYAISNPGIVTVKDNSVRTPSASGLLPGVTSLVNGQTIVFSGGVNNVNFSLGDLPLAIKNRGEYIRIDFTRNSFSYMEIWNYSFFAGYTITASPNMIGLANDNVFTLGGGCLVTITKN